MLLRPAEGARSRLLQELRRSPGLTLCWALTSTVLSVGFARNVNQVETLAQRLHASGLTSNERRLVVNGADPGASIYFDFEGEWNRYGGLVGVMGHPHGLRDRTAASPPDDRLVPSPRVFRTTWEMVTRPISLASSHPDSPGIRPRWLIRFAERSMLRHGWVDARSFLNPIATAKILTDFAEGVTFVYGTLRAGGQASSLQGELLERAGVHPFRFASVDQSALVGFLSAGPRTRLGPAPRPKESVRQIMERYLDPFEVFREELVSGVPMVVHRYDLALAGAPRRSNRPPVKFSGTSIPPRPA